MFKRTLFLALIFSGSILVLNAQALEKKYLENKTYEYDELIKAYTSLSKKHSSCVIMPWGKSDAGPALELVFIKQTGSEEKELEINSDLLTMLVLNGIHAGESCGVDASLHWAESLLESNNIPENTLIIIVPFYNIGGSLNRGCCTRANQNGPVNQGFRGNAQNLDLNRDFMKADSENAKLFQQLLTLFNPDIVMDTHSTNGADYQYTMTLIPYQFEKWPEPLRDVGQKWFADVKKKTNKNVKTQNYVNVWGTSPEAGFSAFEVTSLFSGGYAGLFRALNITSEAHMFKSYQERVEATIFTLDAVLETSAALAPSIKKARAESLADDLKSNSYSTAWEIDSAAVTVIKFDGYEVEYVTSELTGQPRYSYNREKPIRFKTNYYPAYKAVSSNEVPKRYYLHQGNTKAISWLKNAGVKVSVLEKDTTITVSVDYVTDIAYAAQPYEGHFPHSGFTFEKRFIEELFLKGDVIVETNQFAVRYILEALEPQTPGSFFRWNFFDTYLQQKEHFSPYIFEEKAIAFLNENPEIKTEFEALKNTDNDFAKNAFAQLYWIYMKTPYYEKEHKRIPVFRVY